MTSLSKFAGFRRMVGKQGEGRYEGGPCVFLEILFFFEILPVRKR